MGEKLFDKYSLCHFAMGIIGNFLGFNFWQWLLLHTVFEILENTVVVGKFIDTNIPFWPGGKPNPDTFINIVGDTISTMLGWLIAYTVNRK